MLTSSTYLTLGDFTIPVFGRGEQVFGAHIGNYPPYSAIPEEHKELRNQTAAAELFFNGGSLADVGLKIRDPEHWKVLHETLRAYLASWEPKQEHKLATVTWLLATYTEPVAQKEENK